MTLNRSTAPAALVAFFKTLLGTPYSEQSPPGSDADGHLWVPGEGRPNHLDCSGATYYVVREVTGMNIDQGDIGNAAGQWAQLAHLRVSPPIEEGDLLYFTGADGTPSEPGHTGMCVTFNSAPGTGTYISAYDTAEGLCIKPFSVHGGVDGYVGAVRIVNELPAAPLPAPPVVKPPPPEAAVNYAREHGMVQVDLAEAMLGVEHHPEIAWHTWTGSAMLGHSGLKQLEALPPTETVWAFANVLDAAHIPHAGP